MRIPWWAFLLLVGWIVLVIHSYEMKRGYEREIAMLEAAERKVDTLYVQDTVRLTKTRYRTDSVIVRQTDTVIHIDTVKILLANERKACDAVIETCEKRVAIRDSIINLLKKKPSVWSKIPWVLGGFAAGVILK